MVLLDDVRGVRQYAISYADPDDDAPRAATAISLE
jgi:hypothetical protein